MKATKLIEILQNGIEKHGKNVEVFMSVDYKSYKISDDVEDFVSVDDLDEYNPEQIYEIHHDNHGLIHGITLHDGEIIDCGNDH